LFKKIRAELSTEEIQNNTASRPGGCMFEKAAYLPSKVKTATPSARSPRIMLGMAKPKAERPYRRKNSIKHQAEIELGIFILHSPLVKLGMRLREPIT
jgi:hypothetical protein